MRGTIIATTECQWPYSKSPECSAQKPEDSPKALAYFPFIPHPQCMSQAVMTSLNDIRIVCSPVSVGKALCMCRRAMLICLHTSQHPHQLFSTATHEPCCHFHILNSKPVTLSPRYFSVPSYWSLKSIIKI